MKKGLAILTLFLVALTACSTTVSQVQQPVQQQVNAPAVTGNVTTIHLKPEFKLISDHGLRNPPTISGTVKNIGEGDGSVRVTASVLYAGLISSAGSQVIDINSGKEANFSISIDKTAQWTSYKITLESISG